VFLLVLVEEKRVPQSDLCRSRPLESSSRSAFGGWLVSFLGAFDDGLMKFYYYQSRLLTSP
jgi:hypothetical protein